MTRSNPPPGPSGTPEEDPPSRAFASTPTGAPTAPPNCANTSPSSPPAPKRLASFHSCYLSPIVSVPIFRNIAPQSDPLHPHVGLAALAFSRLLHQVPSRVHTIAISVFHLALSVFPGRTPLPDGAHPTHIAVFTSVTDALTAVAVSDSTGDFFDDLCEFAPHVASLSHLDGTQTNAALRFTASMFRLFSKQPLRSPLHLPELSGCILNVLASRRGVTGGERNRFARKASDADANESFGSDVKSSMRARKPSGLDIGAIDISGPLGTSSQPQAEHDDFESALSALVECASTRWYPHRAAPLQALLSELERSERWTRQYSAVWNLVTHLQTLLDERSEAATLPIELGRYFNHICSIMPDAATIVLKFLARLLPSEPGSGVLALEELIKSLGPWYSFCQQQKHERRHLSSALNSVLDSLSCIDVDDCIFYSTLGRSLSSLHLGTEGIASQLSTVETLARLRRSRDHFDGEKLQRSDSGSSASPVSDDAARIEAPIQEANSARTSKDANLQANSRSLYSRQLLEELLRLSTSTIAGARLRANRIYVEAFSESIFLSSSQLHYALSAFYMQAFGPTGEVECMLWTDKALQVTLQHCEDFALVALDTASFALTLLTDAHEGLENGPMPTRETMTLVIACTARIFYWLGARILFTETLKAKADMVLGALTVSETGLHRREQGTSREVADGEHDDEGGRREDGEGVYDVKPLPEPGKAKKQLERSLSGYAANKENGQLMSEEAIAERLSERFNFVEALLPVGEGSSNTSDSSLSRPESA